MAAGKQQLSKLHETIQTQKSRTVVFFGRMDGQHLKSRVCDVKIEMMIIGTFLTTIPGGESIGEHLKTILNVGDLPLMCEGTIATSVNLISATRVWQQSQVFLLI